MLRGALRAGFVRAITLCFVLSCLCVTDVQSWKSMTFWRKIDSNGKIVTEVYYPEGFSGGMGNDGFRSISLAPGSHGNEIVVSEAEGKQGPPNIAYNSSSNEYLIVWWDERDKDAMGRDIYGRLLSRNGDAEIDQIIIAAASGDQEYPDVVYNSISDEYMVIWIDSSTDTLRAQRLSDTGESIGTNIVIAEITSGSVACIEHNNSDDNSYLVVWHVGDVLQQGADIYGQILSSEGSLLGNSFTISEEIDNQLNPASVYDKINNEYVVVWQDYRRTSKKTDSDETYVHIDIYGQRVSHSGQLRGSDYHVSPWENMDWEQLPDIAYNSSGKEFLVVWQDDRDYPEVGIYGRFMNNAGLGVSSFAISVAGGRKDNPAVVYNDADEEYMVVWDDQGSLTRGNRDIYGQSIPRPFTEILEESSFVISDTDDEQAFPDIAYNSGKNEYLVAWSGNRNMDGTGFDIYARRFPDQDYDNGVVAEVIVLSPAGGEIWKGTREVQWEAEVVEGEGNIGAIVLQYSADGTQWINIPFSGSNDGSFSWDTTDIPDGEYEIKVVAVASDSSEWESTSEYFTIDNTAPTVVSDLESPDHTVEEWSNNARIKVQWTPSTDITSGLEGYSAVWDEIPDTTPDTLKNTDLVTDAISPILNTGDSHHFHIRPVDKAGNWGETSHLGPFYIDITPPGEVTELSCTSHAVKIFSSDVNIEVEWKPASDQGSGLDGYSILWDTGLDNLPDMIKDIEGEITGSSAQMTEGMDNYFHIRSVDNVGNWCNTAKHIGPFYIDTTAPTLESISSSHQVNTWSSINTVEIQMVASDKLSGLKGFLAIWDQSPDTEPTDTSDLNTSWTINSPALTDGEWHFHAKAMDMAGNLSEKLDMGSFKIDTIPPGEVCDLSSPSHTPGLASSDDTVDVQWEPAIDLGIGLYGYSVEWDTRLETLPDESRDIDGTVTSLFSEPLSEDTDHYFHIRSVDRLGNWSGKAAHIGPFRIKSVGIIKGDVNGDGTVRSNDAILTLRIVAGLVIPNDYQKAAADINDDGVVKSNDAIIILRIATGLAAPDKTI